MTNERLERVSLTFAELKKLLDMPDESTIEHVEVGVSRETAESCTAIIVTIRHEK
jgi:hypothetical protein